MFYIATTTWADGTTSEWGFGVPDEDIQSAIDVCLQEIEESIKYAKKPEWVIKEITFTDDKGNSFTVMKDGFVKWDSVRDGENNYKN